MTRDLLPIASIPAREPHLAQPRPMLPRMLAEGGREPIDDDDPDITARWVHVNHA